MNCADGVCVLLHVCVKFLQAFKRERGGAWMMRVCVAWHMVVGQGGRCKEHDKTWPAMRLR